MKNKVKEQYQINIPKGFCDQKRIESTVSKILNPRNKEKSNKIKENKIKVREVKKVKNPTHDSSAFEVKALLGRDASWLPYILFQSAYVIHA